MAIVPAAGNFEELAGRSKPNRALPKVISRSSVARLTRVGVSCRATLLQRPQAISGRGAGAGTGVGTTATTGRGITTGTDADGGTDTGTCAGSGGAMLRGVLKISLVSAVVTGLSTKTRSSSLRGGTAWLGAFLLLSGKTITGTPPWARSSI